MTINSKTFIPTEKAKLADDFGTVTIFDCAPNEPDCYRVVIEITVDEEGIGAEEVNQILEDFVDGNIPR